MRNFVVVVSLTLSVLFLGGSSAHAQDANGSIVIADGFAAANTYVGPLPELFEPWCDASCFPTVQLAVYDAKKTRRLGTIYAWGKEFTVSGATLQFKEFILYDLDGGQFYTISQEGGHPGGAFADPSLVPPKEGVVVLLGGAEGLVVGGTGKFAGAGGGYSTRLKVEADGGGNFFYYDELYFRFRQVKVD